MPELGFDVGESLPAYVNNARVEVTDDNVFLDFGFSDPFLLESEPEGLPSIVRARVVMNKSTFATFVEHVTQLREQADEITLSTDKFPIRILSRCPPKVD